MALLLLIDFTRDVKPVLDKRCISCHGPKLALHGLRLDTRGGALKGGDSGAPAVVPGRSAESLLIRYVSGQDKEIVMPPSGPRLPAEEISILRQWIDEGVPYPDTAAPEVEQRSDHWSFQPIRRPEIPAVQDRAWVRNPIDAFILAKLESKGWKPAPAARPEQLLRRVFLNVTGLPPTLEEQERGVAWERLVEDLLSRPTYGERWGRHWLDLVRFAESNGYERDGVKPEAWRYRDYVIASFNKDKPFDRFIAEQIGRASCRERV